MKLVEAVKPLSPFKNNWVFSKMFRLFFLSLLRRVNLSLE